MAIIAHQFGFASSPRSLLTGGNGYFAGEPPADPDPESPDGRARILNVPTRVWITVYERGSMVAIASVLSNSDGTWLIDHLNPEHDYVVIGVDKSGTVNSAIQDWVKPYVEP